MIAIDQINLSVGQFSLSDLSLQVAPGEYFVLLGPTGSGKTLLVECLCGLNRVDSGTIRIGPTDVTHLEPRDRGIGYVPQDYALFPHCSVRGNVAYGLSYRDVPPAEFHQRVDRVLDLLGLRHLSERFPSRLSGGEKQRVALARALAIEPRLLVLDEPVSALDEQTRDTVCRELKLMQKATGTTTVHVCHNFAEMLAVADRVGIIQQGQIVQVGTPQEVLQHPCNTQLARFVQGGNLVSARVKAAGNGVRLECPDGVELFAALNGAARPGTNAFAMVRPENLRLWPAAPDDLPPGTSVLRGVVRDVVELGPVVRLAVACGEGNQWLVSLGWREYNVFSSGVGDAVCLTVDPEHVHVMES